MIYRVWWMKNTPKTNESPFFKATGLIAVNASGQITFVDRNLLDLMHLEKEKIIGERIEIVAPFISNLMINCIASGKHQFDVAINFYGSKSLCDIIPSYKREKLVGVSCIIRIESQNIYPIEALETVFDISHDGLIVYDRTGTFLKMNSASENLNGYEAKKLIGKRVQDLIREEQPEINYVIMDVLENKKTFSKVQYLKKTGKTILVTGTPALDAKGDIRYVVINERDMTQLNELMNKLENALKKEIGYKEKLMSINRLQLNQNDIIAESPKFLTILEKAIMLCSLNEVNILITGESGTGKNIIAKFIHQNSLRKKEPFIKVNCTAIPENLFEAELFGYDRGAFTGAKESGKAGLLELSHKGTAFLDEIGDIPLSIQAKLLNYLDNHEITRLGSTKKQTINCNVIAATNQDLLKQVQDRQFREDLYFRLKSFHIHIPPLRERPEDIPPLINHFVDKYNKEYGKQKKISYHTIGILVSYYWPGNTREMVNLFKSAVAMTSEEYIDDSVLESLNIKSSEKADMQNHSERPLKDLSKNMDEFEYSILRQATDKHKTTRKIAENLGVSQSTIARKLRKYSIKS
jgi:PAS domain S-box-containing protein/TyrR family helix-turn-helix protein